MNIQIIKSRRKTMALEVTSDARVIVRAPYFISESEIRKFVEDKFEWIEENVQKVEKRREQRNTQAKLSDKEIRELGERALAAIPPKVEGFAKMLGVSYGRITIRNQKSRWGSCSAKGNLNFNCLLMLVPEEVLDYVVVHELCHRREMNHSVRFWTEVECILPDYRERRKWLKEYGGDIIARML